MMGVVCAVASVAWVVSLAVFLIAVIAAREEDK